MSTLFICWLSALTIIGIFNLVCYTLYYSQFKAFNENIKDWSREIDSNMRVAIERQAKFLLMDMDAHISAMKEQEEKDEEINNDEIDKEDEI